MRFLHTSDWQIGKPFGFVDDETLAVLRAERLEVIARIGDFAIKHQASAVLVAGDIYDGAHPGLDMLLRPIERMRQFPDVQWHLIPGNHDAHTANSPWERLLRSTMPPNIVIHVTPEPRPIADGSAWVIPAILTHRHMSGDPTAAFESAVTPPGALRIGLAHGSVRSFGSTDHTTNNLLAADRAATARLDYFALGDWHGASRVNDRTWYSGTPEPDGFDLGGLKMSDIGSTLTAMLGGGYVNYFSLDQRSYKVIPQVQQRSRLNAQQLLDYYIASVNGVPVPLSTIARISTKVVPESLNHFQQLNSATLQGVVMPGVAQADALNYLKGLAAKKLPLGYSVDYGGLSRQYVQESSGFVLTFGFALIVIYLSLAALFESFRDPLIILVSVPMSIAGAMIFISVGVGGATLNIYTQVGLVTLMGLISKHGILIVEFANDLRRRGLSKREAIEQAAAIRLRPILMTTAAMVLGVIPLIIASGAGAVSRFNMGLVIASGLSIGTLFTLFVLPAVYLLIAAGGSRESMASDLDAPKAQREVA